MLSTYPTSKAGIGPASPPLPHACLPLVSKLFSACHPVVAGLQTSSTCHRVVSQMSPRCGFPDVVSQLPPRFLHLLSSCCPLVSEPWLVSTLSPGCFPVVSHMFPRCGLRIVSQFYFTIPSCLPEFILPLVTVLFSNPCHLSPNVVFRCCLLYLSPVVSRLSCRRGLPIVSLSLEFGTVTAVDLQRWVNLERQPIPSPQF